MATPITRRGLRANDHLPPVEAVVKAFTEPGRHPMYHREMLYRLKRDMPVLHRALERLVEESRRGE